MRKLVNFYLLSISATALALGIQIVLLPWLSVGVLQLPAMQVGWVQSAVMLPNFVVLLLGGVLADRGYRLMGILLICTLATFLHIGLAIAVQWQWLGLSLLLGYAVLLGTLNALHQPLRESLLPLLDEGRIQKNFSKLFLSQYIMQAIGVVVAGQYSSLGVASILWFQAFSMFVALIFYVCLTLNIKKQASFYDKVNSTSPETSQTIRHSVLQSFRYVWQRPVLRSLVGLAGFNGVVQMGVFIVVMPLLIRDVYGLSGVHYAYTQLSFLLGAVAANIWLLKRGGSDKPGQGILFCLLYTSLLLLGLGAKPTVNGIYILSFFWGVVVGVSTSLARSLLQDQLDNAMRGRVTSIYQLALFGGAPLGALLGGYCVHWWSTLQLLTAAGVVSLITFVLFLLTKTLWQVQITPTAEEGSSN